MRLIISAILYCAAANCSLAADDFPCAAYVAAQRAEVFAGPGQRFYTTQHLERGTKLEIHREETSGWLAIRPPDDSFSWVPAQYIERLATDEQVGRVTQATGVWIGTAVERVSEHRQDVTLKVGEVVEILDEKSAPSRSGSAQTWLKIAPPAGEFRWIHARDVSRQPPPPLSVAIAASAAPETPEIVAETEDEETSPARMKVSDRQPAQVEPQRIEIAGTEIPLRDIRAPIADSKVQSAQFNSTTSPSSRASLSPDGFVARKRPGSEPLAIERRPAVQTGIAAAPVFSRPRSDTAARLATNTRGSAAPAATTQGITPSAKISSGLGMEEIARQLEQIEVELSLMLAKDKSVWDLASLRQRTLRLVEGGNEAASRGRARLLLEKLRQFEGTFDVEEYGAMERASGSRTSTANPGESAAPASGSLTDPRYDAQGWLKPVVSRQNKAAAPYAVVDKDGQPLCFVTPSPGLNLQHYLNKSVGLYGRRGYLEELKKPHLTAQRVIELDRQLR